MKTNIKGENISTANSTKLSSNADGLPKSQTTNAWTCRQTAVDLLPSRKWHYSFLGGTTGSITRLGGQVAEFTSSKFEPDIVAAWITSGIVPAGFETHAPYWFTPVEKGGAK